MVAQEERNPRREFVCEARDPQSVPIVLLKYKCTYPRMSHVTCCYLRYNSFDEQNRAKVSLDTWKKRSQLSFPRSRMVKICARPARLGRP